MPSVSTMRANRFVRHVALAAAYAIVNAHLAHRTERFVVKSRHAQRRAQLLVELAQVLQVRDQRGNLQHFVGQQNLMIASIPLLSDIYLKIYHECDGYLLDQVGALATLLSVNIYIL